MEVLNNNSVLNTDLEKVELENRKLSALFICGDDEEPYSESYSENLEGKKSIMKGKHETKNEIKRKVSFSEEPPEITETHHWINYDRTPYIETLSYKQIEMIKEELMFYKMYEMPVHKLSMNNTSYPFKW